MAGGAENLIPEAHKLTLAEQSAGGKASGVARRKKRTLREIAEAIGNMDVKNPRLLAAIAGMGFNKVMSIKKVSDALNYSQYVQELQ